MEFILPYESISLHDVARVGGKNASLGEMICSLSSQGIDVPSGFAITTDVYRYFCSLYNLYPKISSYLEELDKKNLSNVGEVALSIESLFCYLQIPTECSDIIVQSYKIIEERYGANCSVALRSSATIEDMPQYSCAGQQQTFLNVVGSDALVDLIPQAYASLFSARALSYYHERAINPLNVELSLGVQKMVRSDKASSGVMFTLDPDNGFDNVVVINSVYGLGEALVQGMVNPDEVFVHKKLRKQGWRPILKQRVSQKERKLVLSSDEQLRVAMVDLSENDQNQFSLSSDEIISLTDKALVLEEHYSKRVGKKVALDIEWAKDGIDGKIYIVQTRYETIHSQTNTSSDRVVTTYSLGETNQQPYMQGSGIGTGIISGKVRVLEQSFEYNELQEGEILVTDMTDPDSVSVFKRASGVVTNRGGRTCHAAIISRELGIPAIIGCGNATTTLKTGEFVTLDCSKGSTGAIYKGVVPFTCSDIRYDTIPQSPIPLLGIVAQPDEVFSYAHLPLQGVGLARLEFIISNIIKVHPLALLYPEKLSSSDRDYIERISSNYATKKDFFIEKLSQEVATIAAAFHPRPVTVRLSDFKTNEYRNLRGGESFEPVEENPMIGLRGAVRYYHPLYREAFALECEALRLVRDVMGFANVHIMVPFVRTVQEGEKVIECMKRYGLVQSKDGLQILMMCELPSNIILLDEFCALFDGFSIGSNDLTQLVLGIDRDSHQLAHLFDEQNAAVVSMITQAITIAKSNNKTIGICGEAPSDNFEFSRMLIEKGISSISMHPSRVLQFLESFRVMS